MKRILLVSNEPIFITGMCSLLKNELGYAGTEIASDYPETLDKLRADVFDLVIIAIEHIGLSLSRDILSKYALQPILVYANNLSLPETGTVYRNGVLGVLSQSAGLNEIIQAVKQAILRQIFMTEDFKKTLIGSNQTVAMVLPKKLSNRENEIVELLLKGLKVTEISKNLHLNISTIATFKARIYKKLGVKNLLELERIAIKKI